MDVAAFVDSHEDDVEDANDLNDVDDVVVGVSTSYGWNCVVLWLWL